MPIVLKKAKTATEKEEVYKLRHRVFVKEEQRFEDSSNRIFDIYDTLDENINFMAIEGDEVVGSIRATIENPMGIPALDHYDFSPLMRKTSDKFASVGWLCIAERCRRHRGILPALFKMVIRETKKRGVQHLIAPLHPPILPLLKRFGAKAIDDEFFSDELNVSMVPIHIDYGDMAPGIKEFYQETLNLVLNDSNERRIYRQGEAIIEKGEPGNEAFFVMRGSVEVLAHDGIQHTQMPGSDVRDGGIDGNPLLGQGQLFGELSLIDDGLRTVTVICHSKEADLMVWTKEQLMEQLQSDQTVAMQLCKIMANRLRMEVRGYQKDESHEALVATIIMDAATEAIDEVDLKWLASQCGFRVKEMEALMKRWSNEGIITYDGDHQSIQVCGDQGLKQKAFWK